MKEIEITEIPPVAPGEQSLLDFHSVVNILNVLGGELMVLGIDANGDDRLLCEGLAVSQSILDSLADPALALQLAPRLDELERTVFDEIQAKLTPGQRESPATVETCANLRAVFRILGARSRELLARAGMPGAWESMDIGQLRANFIAVFTAMEKVSKGRYRILYNAACQEKADYYVDFKVEVEEGTSVQMPPVFQDVMRDLIANARKYTAPGGSITAALHEDRNEIRFLVRDTGRGIPETEIRDVVSFGRRASNVADVRTMGGGFGLTKAFMVAKQFGGRFWIASELGRGTQVRIHLPRLGAA